MSANGMTDEQVKTLVIRFDTSRILYSMTGRSDAALAMEGALQELRNVGVDVGGILEEAAKKANLEAKKGHGEV